MSENPQEIRALFTGAELAQIAEHAITVGATTTRRDAASGPIAEDLARY
ncbi:hypothetical protein OG455_19010 [Kitasatospora sp. NBC_01287]|nr:hypothetical protein [Kitasatospora sp. NBC_01287]MCX4747582.1 hypothetical protein [Kitasatospora sp. NBC_01287]